MRAEILAVGRKTPGREWQATALEEYQNRLSPFLDLEVVWHRDNDALIQSLKKRQSRGGALVVLDECGASMGSAEFSDFFFEQMVNGGSRVAFVVGAAEGLPEELKQMVYQQAKAGSKSAGGSLKTSNGKKAGGEAAKQQKTGAFKWDPPPKTFSLSRLTFTHEMALVLLAEQIYRANEIRRNSGYHK
uniref:Uncharacterized protein n=1 Tax=Chromera velia CCMP2878 TaxID=1169474 RepID=A0A0G4I1Y4_9ALVE|eukprot:Cvel_10261.t1-p1 / transcript=Cvel_10261.t1 / gene=Cvel_10261 / organism=Chromera_velia_CCMP2878 / gene_product=Ribosomal RNA large subunit methyltransferase H, putative / transcript_product=Ribosomal RNA large subunit methyltransferase H, putative / location=Cvel_scaffold615:33801-35057(-) / protein_length=187 / sequence_SO=supercontig / SO=protein_coding / is_pseudo=false